MNYEMGGTILSKTVKEKDLGVTMNCKMKVSEQCRIAASKGNQVLGIIRRNVTYKENSLIVPLYKAIVRPHLEYCIVYSKINEGRQAKNGGVKGRDGSAEELDRETGEEQITVGWARRKDGG